MDRDRLSHLPLRILVEVGSTNDSARDWARAGAEDGACVLAEKQTAGRGRLGRSWHGPRGLGITLSQVIRPSPALETRLIPLLGALATRRLAAEALDANPERARIKWPNDVLIDGHKVAGILAEWHPEAAPFAVLGIGLNVNQQAADFPADLRLPATSLRLARGQRFDRTDLVLSLLGHLAAGRTLLEEDRPGFLAEIRKQSATVGRRIRVQTPAGETWDASARAIADDGSLEVETDDGRILRLQASDVHHLDQGAPGA